MATYQIRELSFGEILDGAFAVYRAHFGLLVGIAVICTGLPAVIYMYMTMVGIEFVSAGTVLVWLVLYGVGGLMAAGATIHVISQAYLGQMPRLGEAIRFALGKIGKIFVAGLAKYLIILLASFVPLTIGFVVAMVVADPIVGAAVLGVTLVVATGVAVVFSAAYAVVTQVVVLEQETPATQGLRRSWILTRGFRFKAFGVGVVLGVLMSLPFLAAGVLEAVLPDFAVLFSGGSSLLQFIIYPVLPSALTLLYYDLRVRQEAFDIAFLSRQLGVVTEGWDRHLDSSSEPE
ncbi:MAG: hypothetical protein JSW71_00190 [Gemmatimonadota bacterium]|nr:MAG: hypothetical protein JSW71_00190 [Gemmatimonadota bacterium]